MSYKQKKFETPIELHETLGNKYMVDLLKRKQLRKKVNYYNCVLLFNFVMYNVIAWFKSCRKKNNKQLQEMISKDAVEWHSIRTINILMQ